MKYSKDAKPGKALDKNSEMVSVAILFVFLSGFSFYLGMIFCSNNKDWYMDEQVADITNAITSHGELGSSFHFPECWSDYQDYTPCTDPRERRKHSTIRIQTRNPRFAWHHGDAVSSIPFKLIRHGSLFSMPYPMDRIWWALPAGSAQDPASGRLLVPVQSTHQLREPMERLEHDGGGAESRIRETAGLAVVDVLQQYNKKDDIAVWQNQSDSTCYNQLSDPDEYPRRCDDSLDPDAAWYTTIRACVIVPNPKLKRLALESLAKWPARLHAIPERVSKVRGTSIGTFKQDDMKWNARVKYYKKLVPALGTDQVRNVLDMNTVYGGFGAALVDDPLWVGNVVSSYALNTLPIMFYRGMIGSLHDSCNAFSTYPRTYDLLHLDGLFKAESHRCEMKYVLLEMNRILRSTGHAIIQESAQFADSIAPIAKGMRWSCQKECCRR